MSQDAVLVMLPLTATAAAAPGGWLVAQPMTASAVGIQGGIVAVSASMEAMTATSQAVGGNSGYVDARLEPLDAQAIAAPNVVLSLEAMTASGVSLTGTVGAGTASFVSPTASALGTAIGVGSGAATLSRVSASAIGFGQAEGVGSAVLRPVQAAATGISGTVGVAALNMEMVTAAAVSKQSGSGIGAGVMLPAQALARSDSALPSTFNAWAMNTRHNGMTQYTNFSFNSLAHFNGKYYGGSSAGLMRLGGTDDNAALINSHLHTGFMDNGDVYLKRMPEVIVSARMNGPFMVTVWGHDDVSYDYPAYFDGTTVLRQVRAKCGKGVRSRYYKIGISSMAGSKLDIHMITPMPVSTTRRIG